MGSSNSSPRSSKVHDDRKSRDMRSSRIIEAPTPVASRANDMKTRKKTRSFEANNSKRGKEDREIEQPPETFLNEQPRATLMKEYQAGEGAELPAPRSTGEHLPEIRSTSEDQRQVEELGSLGCAAYARFESTGDIKELTKAIEYLEIVLALSSGLPLHRSTALSNLGCAYESRFSRLGELADLNKAIEFQTQAVLLTPGGHLNTLASLNNLGISYSLRFDRLGELSDLDKSIELQAGAVSLIPDDHQDRPAYLNNLGTSYETRFKCLGELSDLEKAIESQAQAVSLTPSHHRDKPAYLNNLGNSYHTRFAHLGNLSDLNKAIESKAQAVSLTPDGHPDKPGRFSNLGNSYETRFERLGELPDLQRAIDFKERAVLLTPDGHPKKRACLKNLGISYELRFGRLGELSDLNKAIDFQTQALSLTPSHHPGKPGGLNNIGISYEGRFKLLGELSDLDQAIEYQTQAISLAPDGHPGKPSYLNSLGSSYESRFSRLGEHLDLNNAIESKVQAVSLTPDGHPDKPSYLYSLGISYETRFKEQNRLSDIRLAVSSFRGAAQSPTGSPWTRFYACREWARLTSFDTSASPHPAYNHAMQLLPQLVWVGSSLDRRYELIAQMGAFAAEAASHAISFAAYDLALEWLEAGRSIIWSQIAQLRTPFDRLAAHDAPLANQLQQVSRELERVGSRSSPQIEAHNDDRDLIKEANSHIELALKWDYLLTKVRSIPGFEDFLRPPKVSQLLGAAKSCPIAIINIHKSRCDALILRPNIDFISHIPLTGFSQETAVSARKHLVSQVGQRGFKKAGGKPGSTINKSNSLEESLKDLWVGVVHPVLAYLGFMDKSPSEALPHITWCTTGLLSFLPLHAAGCYDQPGSSTFEHVISSYTPTLSALSASQSELAGIPSGVVAVGQEHTPGFSSLPCVNDELKVIKRHAHTSAYLQLEGSEATVDQVLDAMA